MRPAALAGLVLVLFASYASAQQQSYRAVVSDAEVKLRAGPSDAFPDTGTLPRGSVVIVEREENSGWLAIAAPHGSVSWIAAAFVATPFSGEARHQRRIDILDEYQRTGVPPVLPPDQIP